MVNGAHSKYEHPPPPPPPPPSHPTPPPTLFLPQTTTKGVHGKLLTLAGGELLQIFEGEGALGGEPQAGGMMEGRLED